MRNITLISASAGSGKTYSLSRKIFEAVARGIAPERIMAVTFTNKAAAELTERIRHKLVQPEAEWVKELNLDADQLQGLREKAASLSDAYIGTVNSICARLLREFAFEAGLSPAIDILPEEEAERLFRLAVSHQIGKYYADLSTAARRLGRDGSGKGFQKKPDWKEDVKKLVDLARANGLSADDLRGMEEASRDALTALLGKPQSSLSSHEMRTCIESAIRDIQGCDDTTKATKDTLSKLRRIRHAMMHGYDTWADWSALASMGAGKRSGADGCLDQVREYAVRVQHHPDLHSDVVALIHGVFNCAAESLEGFDSFKRIHGLMDFVDQESKVLELLDHPSVRDRLRERLELVMVDEFQDTSPIQLALFSGLSELVETCVWVGDQKQAIYGFRGTDPQLMDEVIDRLETAQLEVLGNSWRSRPELVGFANELFTHAFSEMPGDRVRLQAKREDDPGHAGALEVWRVAGDNKALRAAALAEGIADLIRNCGERQIMDRESGEMRPLKGGDIAVLCRTNSGCEAMAEALGAYGIQASFGRGNLFSAPECAAVLAGLRLLVDDEETLALAELVQYLPGHASASSWLEELAGDQKQAFANWRSDSRVEALMDMQAHMFEASPLELMQAVSDILNIRHDLYSGANPKQALANLESLERLVVQYQDSCGARHQAASLPGLIYWLSGQDDPGLPEGRGEHTVQVCSYHKSKGLEWPLVILSDLDAGARISPFGLHVRPAELFDPARPLANRSIRYWSQPLSGKELPFTEMIENSPEYSHASETEQSERRRLMYVGITRARDYLILTKPVGKRAGDTVWLNELIDNGDHAIRLPEPDDQEPAIEVAGNAFACRSMQLLAPETPENLAAHAEHWYVPALADVAVHHLPSAVSPSMYEPSVVAEVNVQEMAMIGEKTELLQRVDMRLVGEAVHGLIAADQSDLDPGTRHGIAAAILAGWGVEHVLNPEQLITFSRRLDDWIRATWPMAIIRKEWPMKMRLPNRQRLNGWIDMLVETPDGFVIIDHKSYPGANPVEHAKEYAVQLAIYRQAVEQAAGKPVLQTLIHMPLQGLIVKVSLRREESNHE